MNQSTKIIINPITAGRSGRGDRKHPTSERNNSKQRTGTVFVEMTEWSIRSHHDNQPWKNLLSCRPFKVFLYGNLMAKENKATLYTESTTSKGGTEQHILFALPQSSRTSSSVSSCLIRAAFHAIPVQMAALQNKRYSHYTDKIKFTPAAVLSPQYHTICCLQVSTLPQNRFHELIA